MFNETLQVHTISIVCRNGPKAIINQISTKAWSTQHRVNMRFTFGQFKYFWFMDYGWDKYGKSSWKMIMNKTDDILWLLPGCVSLRYLFPQVISVSVKIRLENPRENWYAFQKDLESFVVGVRSKSECFNWKTQANSRRNTLLVEEFSRNKRKKSQTNLKKLKVIFINLTKEYNWGLAIVPNFQVHTKEVKKMLIKFFLC